MNYQWQVNTMVGDDRGLEHEMQLDKSHRKNTRRRSKHRSQFGGPCRGLQQWCTKCCKQEDSDSDSIKSDASFFKRRRRKKRQRIEDREEVTIEDEDKANEELVSSEELDVPYQVSEEEVPREKVKKDRRKHRKQRRSSEDSLFKASEASEASEVSEPSKDQEHQEQLEVVKATSAETSHPHAYKHNNDYFRNSIEMTNFEVYQDRDYHGRKAERTRKHHEAQREVDFEKSCCYLCARNSMAIAAAKPSKRHRSSQVSDHTIQPGQAKKETCDKSCTHIINVRTVQSWVRVKTCDKCTLCPESKKKDKVKHKSKYKKFGIFPKFKLTKCPATKAVACETDRNIRQGDKKKHTQKYERCCG